MVRWTKQYLFVCLVSFLVLPYSIIPAQAQSKVIEQKRPISLIADSVQFDPKSGLFIASGNVQVFSGRQLLKTNSIVYDQRNGVLSVPGPMTLTEGDLVTRAQRAELDKDLRNGLIEGAELLIQQQLQLVSKKMHRQNGKFKILDKAIATTCVICENNPTPIWRIRSRRIIHDEEAKHLYFEKATLDVLGVPVLFLPNLRVPDPSMRRAAGFLVPNFKQSNTLGYGVEIPYYLPLGNHADLTLNARAYTKDSFLLNPQYRRELKQGQFKIDGFFTLADSLTERDNRSSLNVNGLFQLKGEIDLEFGIEVASDRAFRDDYGVGFENKDRLTSFINVHRTRKDSFISISSSVIQSLRAVEIDQEIPLVLPEIYARKVWTDPVFGVKMGLTAQSVNLQRKRNNEFSRFGIVTDVQKNWTSRNGLIVGGYAGIAAISYNTKNISSVEDGSVTELVPTAAADLRWPLSRQDGRVTHTIEPRVQLVWSPKDARSNPNEDSVQVDFEENNLFSINRFPGYDTSERGVRTNIGVSYTRRDPLGWAYGLTLGQVLRPDDLKQFGMGSGLDGTNSDYITAINLSYTDQLKLTNRTLFDNHLAIGKNEMQMDMNFDNFLTQASYVWLEQDVVAGSSDRTHEASLGLQYKNDDFWTFLGKWRQNLETGRSTSGEFGVRFENECIAMNLSYSLQFEGSGIKRATRELGLRVELAGLGNKKRNKKYAQRCASFNR